jgi:G:T/U-mismatch repair DNA glycosylase
MVKIKHKFENHIIQKDTRILIVGTFNPDSSENEAEFFYGRSRNFLWQLLPACFDEQSIKNTSVEEKLKFIQKYRIDFVDLIREVHVPSDESNNYFDSFIDRRITKWNEAVDLIVKHPSIQKVAITRKTFSGIPNMKTKILDVKDYCIKNRIAFRMLLTPARFYSEKKQKEWKEFIKTH